MPVRPNQWALIGWAYLLGYGGWAAAMLADSQRRSTANDLLFLPFYLGAGWAALRAARAWSDQPRLVRGWRLVGGAWLISGLGSVLWLIQREWPSPLLDASAWAVYNLYYPLVLVGLWHFVERPTEPLGRLKLAVEGLIAMVATAVLAWYLVFRYGLAGATVTETVQAIGVLFLGELLVVGVSSAILHRPTPPASSGSLIGLALGGFSAAVADFAYEQNRLLGTAWSGWSGDLLLALGATLVFTAAVARANRAGGSASAPAVAVGLTLLPFVAVGLVAALLIWESVRANLGSGPIAGLIISGAILLLLVIVRLIVAQREYSREATARAAQGARFRSLVEKSSDAILVVTPAGQIRWASPTFSRMVRSDDGEVPGQPLFAFVPPSQVDKVRDWLARPAGRLLAGWQLGRHGDWRDVEALGTDLSTDPSVGGVVVNIRDVSERVRLEGELRQAQKMEAVGRLASSIAHDFNNLLTVILGNLQLGRSGDSAERSGSLGEAEAATRRGVTLARQLLSLARPAKPTTKVADLGALVRGLDGTIRSVLPGSIALRIDTPRDRVAVAIDEVQIEQILLNLSINARDAMTAGGLLGIGIEVRSTAEGRADAVITVRDSGTGMSPATRDRAFEPFFTTKPEGLGTGLGLATVRRLATELGGRVTLDSAPGRGTTVEVWLPLAEPFAAVTNAETGARPGSTASGAEGPHVLVVDDEPGVRRVLSRQLSAAGYRVTEAADATGALAALRATTTFDLVLTDLVMPGIRGDELARRVGIEFPAVKVLCMSGTPAESSGGSEPWSQGRVITKPIEIEILTDRIDSALGDS